MSRLMLLDSASMYFRSFYGIPDRFEATDGTPVNAVRGFLDATARLITQFRPDELMACWDNDWRPQFRVDLLPSYKAHRVAEQGQPDDEAAEEIPDRLSPQEPVIAEVLAALGIARLGSDGFEADDVMAQLARDRDGAVDVVSGDRDLFQVVEPSGPTRVIYTSKGMNNLQLVNDDWLESKYGVTGATYADLSLMRGDASDGLPGVAGIGEKTGATLINRFGTLGAIQAAAENPASEMAKGVRSKILDARGYIAKADPVIRLDHPVPLEAVDPVLPKEPVDPERLVELVDFYRIESPVNRLLVAMRGD